MATKITGSAIRAARKQKGLSQIQLADGICTQATISMIENRDNCPSFEILNQICQRLEIKLTDVSHNPRYGDKLFSYIEEDMRRHLYIQAQQRIGKVNFDKLDNRFAEGKYYCYKGFVKLYIDDDLDEAIYHFNWMLTQYKCESLRFYHAWSNLGLELAYQKFEKPKRALRYIEQSIQILDQIKHDNHDICAVTDLYIDIIATFLELNHFDRARQLCTAILNRLTADDCLYKVDVLEELESRCLYAQGKIVEATMKQFTAMFVAELRGNQTLCNKIKDKSQAHIIQLVKQELNKIDGRQTLSI